MVFLLERVKNKYTWLFILLLASNCQEHIYLQQKCNEDLQVQENTWDIQYLSGSLTMSFSEAARDSNL